MSKVAELLSKRAKPAVKAPMTKEREIVFGKIPIPASWKPQKQKMNGKPIYDAREPFTFSVSSRDRNRAAKKDPMSCALAKGLLHQDGVREVHVGQSKAVVEYRKICLRYSIQNEDQKRIRAFDNTGYFAPGTYTLVPVKSYKAKDKRKRHGKGGSSSMSLAQRVARARKAGKAQPLRHMWRHAKAPEAAAASN